MACADLQIAEISSLWLSGRANIDLQTAPDAKTNSTIDTFMNRGKLNGLFVDTLKMEEHYCRKSLQYQYPIFGFVSSKERIFSNF